MKPSAPKARSLEAREDKRMGQVDAIETGTTQIAVAGIRIKFGAGKVAIASLVSFKQISKC